MTTYKFFPQPKNQINYFNFLFVPNPGEKILKRENTSVYDNNNKNNKIGTLHLRPQKPSAGYALRQMC